MIETKTPSPLSTATRLLQLAMILLSILAAAPLVLSFIFHIPRLLSGASLPRLLYPLPVALALASLGFAALCLFFGKTARALETGQTPGSALLTTLRIVRGLSGYFALLGGGAVLYHLAAPYLALPVLSLNRSIAALLGLILGAALRLYFAGVLKVLQALRAQARRSSALPRQEAPQQEQERRNASRPSRPATDPRAWDKLVLPPELLDELKGMVEVIRDVGGFRRKWGIEPPLGMILVGPPGNGKTEIAKAFARAGGYSFFKVSGADIRQSNAYGAAENAIREIYEEARAAAPSVVFIDEMDSIAAKRRANPYDGASSEDNHVVNQLLQDIQGFETSHQFVFTIGATNHFEALDPAITSRLRKHIRVENPDAAARLAMLELFTRQLAERSRLEADLAAVARESDGLSGRDLQNVVSGAVMTAERLKLQALTTELLLDAVAELKKGLLAPDGQHENAVFTPFPYPLQRS